jgi:hypothetical protein
VCFGGWNPQFQYYLNVFVTVSISSANYKLSRDHRIASVICILELGEITADMCGCPGLNPAVAQLLLRINVVPVKIRWVGIGAVSTLL